jgi:hypothetical protein
VLRTAVKIIEKTVNELAYPIQGGAILIVCQSADTKHPQDCFLSASPFTAFLIDRDGVTGGNSSAGATWHKVQPIAEVVDHAHILSSLKLCEFFLLQHSSPVGISMTANAQQVA